MGGAKPQLFGSDEEGDEHPAVAASKAFTDKNKAWLKPAKAKKTRAMQIADEEAEEAEEAEDEEQQEDGEEEGRLQRNFLLATKLLNSFSVASTQCD